jgi:hypothetical protein
MDKEIVQRMIVSRRAIPLPDIFCHVMDSMYHWGRCINAKWYMKTLELFKFYLFHHDIDFHRRCLVKRFLYREVIRIRMNEILLSSSFQVCHYTVLRNWSRHYNEHVDNGETDFYLLAVSSIEFVRNEMNAIRRLQVQSQANSAMTVVSNCE